jgi:ribosomal silencing factor RsfS
MNDKKHMRFLAACFAIVGGNSPKEAVNIADELIEELENEKNVDNGIAAVIPKRTRKRSDS